MCKTIRILICALFMMTAFYPVLAQDRAETVAGVLIYVKQLESGEYQVVSLDERELYQADVPDEHCWGVLAEGEYLAFLESVNPETLEIVRLDGTPVRNVPWDDNWQTVCYHGWNNRGPLVEILLECDYVGSWETARYTYMRLDVTSGEISGPYTEIVENCDVGSGYVPHGRYYLQGVSAQLPGFIADDTVAISAVGMVDMYVYERCVSGEIFFNEWYNVEECNGPNETVIYDAARDEIIEVLTDFPDLSIDYRFGGVAWGPSRFAWSPSGQYLAYQSDKLKLDTVRVYDVVDHQYWLPILAPEGYEFVRHSIPGWSPDEQTIILSLRSWQDHNPITTLSAYYRGTEELVPFGPPQESDWDSLRWSADGQSIVFVMSGELFHWEVGQDSVTVLDDDVVDIVAWLSD